MDHILMFYTFQNHNKSDEQLSDLSFHLVTQ